MSGDYSRKRFNPEKHYQGVLRQQGRVDLDADFNEYVDLQDRCLRAGTIDGIGRYGVPSETPRGFQIAIAAGQLAVGQGRCYVDGLRAENHGGKLLFNATLEEKYGTAPLRVDDQPYGAGPVAIPKQVRVLVYLDVWRREVTYLQEPQLIEPAVGDVDTTTRDQTAWQVKLFEKVSSDVTCETPLTDIAGWPAANLPSAARLTTTTVAVTSEPDPCLVPPSGGYRGLENHLYRVEVHNVTENGPVQMKWSRDNANVASPIVEILIGRTGIKVESLGRDEVLRFRAGDFVEITDDRHEFAGLPGEMRKVTVVDDTNQTMSFIDPLPDVPEGLDFLEGPADAATHLRVYRWDESGIVRKPDGSELINLDLTTDGLILLTAANPSFVLEDGIEVTLSIPAGGTAHAGDYWCFAARTADGAIELLDQAPPLGIHHHFCKLAIIEVDGSMTDCRPVFPPLTELLSLFYLSGDGQEALPGQTLPKPIQVGIARGERPVPGARVNFRVTAGTGSLAVGTLNGGDITIATDNQGIASCTWTLGPIGSDLSQQVEARLENGAHLPVRFNAALSQAGGIDPGIHVQSIVTGNTPLRNDTDVTVLQLLNGIRIDCDAIPSRDSVRDKPVCCVTLDLVWPFNDVDTALWGSDIIGFQPIVLAADVDSDKQTIVWRPKPETGTWLESRLFQTMTLMKRGDRVLAHLTLRGNFIWDEQNPDLYLDGEVFGTRTAGTNSTDIKLASGDGRRGGTLDMWFWLVEATVTITITPPSATVLLGRQVNFEVNVQGTTDRGVNVFLDPTVGTVAPSTTEQRVWTYTAPTQLAQNQSVDVTANSVADPTKVATARVLVDTKVVIPERGDVTITIIPSSASLAPNQQKNFTVTVQGGDSTQVELRVNGVLNGGPSMGTIEPSEDGPGVWRYTAPRGVPVVNPVEITATSLEDTTKSATAVVTIIPPGGGQIGRGPIGNDGRGGMASRSRSERT